MTNILLKQQTEKLNTMVEKGYTNKQVQDISGGGASAVTRWKAQYKQYPYGRRHYLYSYVAELALSGLRDGFIHQRNRKLHTIL